MPGARCRRARTSGWAARPPTPDARTRDSACGTDPTAAEALYTYRESQIPYYIHSTCMLINMHTTIYIISYKHYWLLRAIHCTLAHLHKVAHQSSWCPSESRASPPSERRARAPRSTGVRSRTARAAPAASPASGSAPTPAGHENSVIYYKSTVQSKCSLDE